MYESRKLLCWWWYFPCDVNGGAVALMTVRWTWVQRSSSHKRRRLQNMHTLAVNWGWMNILTVQIQWVCQRMACIDADRRETQLWNGRQTSGKNEAHTRSNSRMNVKFNENRVRSTGRQIKLRDMNRFLQCDYRPLKISRRFPWSQNKQNKIKTIMKVNTHVQCLYHVTFIM